MTDHTIGMRETCTRCTLDIEWTGTRWHDRGGNTRCPDSSGGFRHLVKLDCGHRLLPPAGIGTGYAETPDGVRVCYRCADEKQRRDMRAIHASGAGRVFGYMSADTRTVTTWTGGKLATVTRATSNRRQTFVRATDADGNRWAGVGPADTGIYVSLRPVAGASW